MHTGGHHLEHFHIFSVLEFTFQSHKNVIILSVKLTLLNILLHLKGQFCYSKECCVIKFRMFVLQVFIKESNYSAEKRNFSG